MTPADADAAVRRGAAVLDERGPAGWREVVRAAVREDRLWLDVPMLELGVASEVPDCGCVLALTHGSYWDALGMLSGIDPDTDEAQEWAVDRGFCADIDALDDLAAAWARLLGAEVPT